MRISVVIPTFNNNRLTRRCVDALLSTTPPDLLADVVVVDDASTDGASAAWTAAQSSVTPLLLPQNRGFGGACNAGAARCSGEAILFLNNDAFARPGSVAALRAVLAEDSAVGVAGARLLYADGTLQHAGMALLPGSAGAWWHVYKHLDGDLAAANIACDYLAVTGAALLIRRALFARLGGFDEGYANGWEDVDLCLRVWCAGARVRYEPRAVLEHLESATIGRPETNAANMRRFAGRWSRLLRDAPRYPLPEIPPVALAVDATVADGDAWALAHLRQWWGAHLGAAVTPLRPGSRFGRARIDLRAALARRLPTLEVAWGPACLAAATGSRRAAFVAPRSAQEARTFAAAQSVSAWWAPTAAARDALVAAGCAPERVTVVRLGATPAAPPERDGDPIVAAADAAAPIVTALALAGVRPRRMPLLDGTRPDLSDVDIVLTTAVPDRWGLLVPAALANGCRVVATEASDDLGTQPGLTIATADGAGAALTAAASSIVDLRARAATVALDAGRQFNALLATKRAAELARALAGGVPPASAAAVDGRYATRLRAARFAAEVHAP